MSEKKTKPEETDSERKDSAEFNREEKWARPVAMAKDRNLRAWLLLCGLVCFCVALWPLANRAYWKFRNRAISQEDWPRTASGFVAISYEGVAREKEPSGLFITTEAFKTHLEALKKAGYHPIGLEDVRAFYEEGKLLPEKAVLLTFENGHRSTYFEIREYLLQQHWKATMGVVTAPVKANSADVLLRPYLKDMILDATWDLAAESDLGDQTIPVSPHGRNSLFFSSPKWLAEQNRYERFGEFHHRIEADHEAALAEFTENLGLKPLAFFFPKGNYGQFEENNTVLREANLAAVGEHYSLGFILNQHALNDADTDRRRLNRLSIPADWTAETLLSRLDNAWPVEAKRGRSESRILPERWIADWGILESQRSMVSIQARPASDPNESDADATGGARAWISGSNSFKDGSFDLRFRLVRGEFQLYLRFHSDDDWMRLAISDAGRVFLSRCVPGAGPEIIAEDAIEDVSDFRSIHQVMVTVRDDILYARLDGELLFKRPVVIDDLADTTGGLVGVGVWSSSAGLAQLDILESHLRSRTDAVLTWAPLLAKDAGYLAKELNRQAFRYTIIAPPWLDVYAGSSVALPTLDSQALAIIAAANHVKIYPEMALHDKAALTTLKVEEVLENLEEAGVSGVYVDASDYPIDQLPALREWFVRLRGALDAKGLGVAIRFPRAIANLAAVGNFITAMPNVQVVDDHGEVPPGVDARRVLSLLRLDPPATDENMTLFYQLSDYNVHEGDAELDEHMYRQRGLKAYAEGRYAEAAELWTKWQENEPRSAEAWALLGNAYSRMHDQGKAIHAYGESLALEPGQITLLVEQVRLMGESGRSKDAANLLDAYARAFPDDPEIASAQANWLDQHGRRAAGRKILRAIVDRDPMDIQCRLTLQGLLDDPKERYENMHELLDIASEGDARLLGFGHDIASAELLTILESSVFFDMIRETASNAPSESVRTLYDSFLPFSKPITEKFDASRLSDNWIALGTPLANIAGAYDLQASSDMSEAYLRLKKSELLRDGYIEVTLNESVGAFWLYARRSSKTMIRFGFDGDGYLRIQTWANGNIRTGESHAWIRPAGDITLRLEVRGDGAIGFVDGKEVFQTPLKVPLDIAYGWWSIAPFSPELGIARARIGYISAGPLRPTMALIRETEPEAVANALDALRPHTREISAVAPVLFAQSPDGVVLSEPFADIMTYRMFCSYHRLRLVPVVALDYYSNVEAEKLVHIIQTNRLEGLVLLVRSQPSEEWYAKMTKLLERTSADLIVLQSEKPLWTGGEGPSIGSGYMRPDEIAEAEKALAEKTGAAPEGEVGKGEGKEKKKGKPGRGDRGEAQVVVLREIQRGSVLLQPLRSEWEVKPIRDLEALPKEKRSAEPLVIIVPHDVEGPLEEEAEEMKASEEKDGGAGAAGAAEFHGREAGDVRG